MPAQKKNVSGPASVHLQVYLTVEDAAETRKNASDKGLSVSRYVEVALQTTNKSIRDS